MEEERGREERIWEWKKSKRGKKGDGNGRRAREGRKETGMEEDDREKREDIGGSNGRRNQMGRGEQGDPNRRHQEPWN